MVLLAGLFSYYPTPQWGLDLWVELAMFDFYVVYEYEVVNGFWGEMKWVWRGSFRYLEERLERPKAHSVFGI